MVGHLLTTVQWSKTGLSKPGWWAYPDMLDAGCQHGPGCAGGPRLSLGEMRSHFGARAIVSSPLVLSHAVISGATLAGGGYNLNRGSYGHNAESEVMISRPGSVKITRFDTGRGYDILTVASARMPGQHAVPGDVELPEDRHTFRWKSDSSSTVAGWTFDLFHEPLEAPLTAEDIRVVVRGATAAVVCVEKVSCQTLRRPFRSTLATHAWRKDGMRWYFVHCRMTSINDDKSGIPLFEGKTTTLDSFAGDCRAGHISSGRIILYPAVASDVDDAGAFARFEGGGGC